MARWDGHKLESELSPKGSCAKGLVPSAAVFRDGAFGEWRARALTSSWLCPLMCPESERLCGVTETEEPS